MGISDWLLIAALLLLVLGLAIGLYTRRGSGIQKHPTQNREP